MKEKLAHIVSENLIEKLIDRPFAFAAWRMPKGKDVHLAVSLDSPIQTSLPLHELSPGFLFNRFADNHPCHPYHIKGDLIFSNEEVTISPTLSAERVDEFITTISGTKEKPRNESIQTTDATDFELNVKRAIEEIKAGTLEKVVLARFEDFHLPGNFSASTFFEKICEAYTNSFCSMVYIQDEGLWIGASPETLLSSTEDTFKTISLAGTKKLNEGQSLSEIAWTQKEIEEQAFVSRYIINCFKKIRLREFHEHGPKTVQAGNLAHLKTDYTVNLKEAQFESLADQMVELLHPTSAVCGMPLDAAKAFIASTEEFDREFYAGFLGPVNFNGSTDLFVNLRCMKLLGSKARFFAGAGITEDSNPTSELLETQLKISVLKSLI